MQLIPICGVAFVILSSISASPLYERNAKEVESPHSSSGQTDETISETAKLREKRQLRTYWNTNTLRNFPWAVSSILEGLRQYINRGTDSPVMQLWDNIGRMLASMAPGLFQKIIESVFNYLRNETSLRINGDTGSGSG